MNTSKQISIRLTSADIENIEAVVENGKALNIVDFVRSATREKITELGIKPMFKETIQVVFQESSATESDGGRGMKVYPEGARPLKDVLKKFQKEGFYIDRTKYDKEFSDWMTFYDPEGTRAILFNVCNNRFIVFDPDTRDIIGTEASAELEAEDWYMEILGIIFKGEPIEKGKVAQEAFT
ncbi:MAG: hypothetical protein FWD92_03965 [Methanomassiliicoccaceae archaeon]|nr:hypothetical protein [Methanomassiliicoccaceae archaeon]